MRRTTSRLISAAMATALMMSTAMPGISYAGAMEDLEAAARKEGQLTVIALPHDWCGYGGVIAGFKAKYPEITVNELNPDAGSADELEAVRANKDNKGPQAPDVIDVGLQRPRNQLATRENPEFLRLRRALFDFVREGQG